VSCPADRSSEGDVLAFGCRHARACLCDGRPAGDFEDCSASDRDADVADEAVVGDDDLGLPFPVAPNTGLVFTTRSGLPVEPRNLVRSFRRICDHNGIRPIKIHHLRHMTASLLQQLRLPPRDAQTILGHAHIATTMQIYTHVDEGARNEALTGLDQMLTGGQ
jgi:integrase